MIIFGGSAEERVADALYRLTLMPCNDSPQEERAYAEMCRELTRRIRALIQEIQKGDNVA